MSDLSLRARRRLVRAGAVIGAALAIWGAGAVALDAYGRSRGAPSGQWDAIIVCGCRVMPDGTASPALARRTRAAIALWKAHVAPVLVFTGGVGGSPPAEAEVSARMAREAGVPASAIVIEDRSTTTEENARFARAVVPDDVRRVIVVSDAYHVWRAERFFRRHFALVRGVGTVADAWPRTKGAMREVIVVVVQSLS